MAKHKAVWRGWQIRGIALSLSLSIMIVTPLLLPGAFQPAPSKPPSPTSASTTDDDPANPEIGQPPYVHRYNGEPDPLPGELLVRFKAAYIPRLQQALVSANRLNPASQETLVGSRIDANHLYEASPELNSLFNNYGVWAADAIIPEQGAYRLKLDPTFEPRATALAFAGSGFFDYAEPNFPVYAFREPNDPLYRAQQWGLKQINAPDAWDITTGSDSLVIAVVDSGVLPSHTDLIGKVLNGMNFSADPANQKSADDNGHGTYVAGIAAANTNNSIGLAGVAWNARILPVKVLDADGLGTNATIAMGVKYATEQKVQVINISLGGPERARVVEDAVRSAFNQGIVVVASVGNNGTNQPNYPAAFEGVIGVGAYNQQGEAAPFSSFGPELSITAPGVNIVGPSLGSPAYISDSGTSSAAPFVSGAAALMLSVNPTLSNIQIRNILEGTADNFKLTDVTPVNGSAVRPNSMQATYDTRLGWGRLNLSKALQAAQRGDYYPSRRGRVQGFISGLDPLDTILTLQPGGSQVPDGSGYYAFPNLPPGSYTLKVESRKYSITEGPTTFLIRGFDGEVYSQDYDLGQEVKDVMDAGPPIGAFKPLAPGLGVTNTPIRRYFLATGHTVRNKFLQFWLSKGDLPLFGYPISEEFQEANASNRSYLVQYFERAVFEYHPEYAGTDAEIQLRLLGSEAAKGRTDKAFSPVLPPALQFVDGKLLNVFYSPETKHTIRGKFLEYWLANGRVPILGLPISEEMEENGRQVQYFERYRLEIYPEYAGTPWEIIGSLLARDSAEARGLLPHPQ